MKKFSKLIASLALVLAAALLTSSALPALIRAEDRNSVQPAWTVPEGYNAHDYEKCVNFLEQTDENGVKNGDKLSDNYDPNDPGTWGEYHFEWFNEPGYEKVINRVSVDNHDLCGNLDFSGCTALLSLFCSNNRISSIDVSECELLSDLDCKWNDLIELDISDNYCLEFLHCEGNHLTELDVSILNLTEIDVLRANGNGTIGFSIAYDGAEDASVIGLYACPLENAVFEGFYSGDGELISMGELGYAGYYLRIWNGLLPQTVIASFSPECEPTQDPVEPIDSPAPAEPTEEPEPVEPTAEPAPVEPTDEPAPVEPTDEPAPIEPTDEPAPVEPTDEPAPVEPSDEPAPVEPTAVPAPAEPTPAPVPAPPATGTVALIGLGVISAISGLGITVFRKKND